MGQKSLSNWLKLVIVGTAICGVIVYAIVFPAYGADLVSRYPEFSDRYWPWLVFLWVTGVPCYAALAIGWRIAERIGRDQSFTSENARGLKWVSWLAAGDAAAFFLGNVILLLLNMSHPGVLLLSLMVAFAGVAVAVAAAALSHLVEKAVGLQEQSDLTI